MICVQFENDEYVRGFETQKELDDYVKKTSKKIIYQNDDGVIRSEYFDVDIKKFGIYLPQYFLTGLKS